MYGIKLRDILLFFVMGTCIHGSTTGLESNLPKITTVENRETWVHDVVGKNQEFCQTELRFDVKGSDPSAIQLYDKEKTQLLGVVLKGNSNTKSYMVSQSQKTEHLGRVLEPTQFRSFKIEYINESIRLYNHNLVTWQLMMKIEDISSFQYRYVSVMNKDHVGEWIIKGTDPSLKSAWRTNLFLQNLIFHGGEGWKRKASNFAICTLYCNADISCNAYNFSPQTLACRGYVTRYFDASSKKTEFEFNAVHYYKYEI